VREQSLFKKIGRILFPLLLYECFTVLYQELLGLLTGGRLWEPEAAMWLLALKNMLMLPAFWFLYRREKRPREAQKGFGGREVLLVILGAVCISRGINYVLALTPLPYYFTGYEAVSEGIYRCSLPSQIAASVVSAALLEEVLMRGVIYGRLREMTENPRAAMVLSALLFGLFHGNVVQGVYAFVMGLFFVQVFEACGSLFLSVLAHMAANSASVLAGRIVFSDAFYGNPIWYYLLTAGFLMAGMLCWGYFLRK